MGKRDGIRASEKHHKAHGFYQDLAVFLEQTCLRLLQELNFQSFEKIDFDSIPSVLIAFTEKQIFRGPYSDIPKLRSIRCAVNRILPGILTMFCPVTTPYF